MPIQILTSTTKIDVPDEETLPPLKPMTTKDVEKLLEKIISDTRERLFVIEKTLFKAAHFHTKEEGMRLEEDINLLLREKIQLLEDLMDAKRALSLNHLAEEIKK